MSQGGSEDPTAATGSAQYPIAFESFSLAVGTSVSYAIPVALSSFTTTGFAYQLSSATKFRWIATGK